MSWRLICDDGVGAAFGLAADDYMAGAVGRGESDPLLRLYTYRDHCALAGRFQDVENEIHLDFCRGHGIAVNRRPTGGGTIFMGRNQLGVALCIPGKKEDTYGRAREVMGRFSEGIIRGLQSLGVRARFRRKNDIEVEGRKIAGLGIFRDSSGGLLFHSSILVDMDIALMLKVLNTPFEKISDKEIATVDQRITTVCRESGRALSTDQVRQAVATGYKEVFNTSLTEGYFSTRELERIALRQQEKYERPEWIYQTSRVKDAEGMCRIKTEKGLLEVRLTLAGRQIKALFIRGDFFASETAIADVEGHFRWHAAHKEKIEETLNQLYHKHNEALSSLPQQSLLQAIVQALSRARVVEKKLSLEPYGCFVSPGGNLHA